MKTPQADPGALQ